MCVLEAEVRLGFGSLERESLTLRRAGRSTVDTAAAAAAKAVAIADTQVTQSLGHDTEDEQPAAHMRVESRLVMLR